jgi:hypothetical protein
MFDGMGTEIERMQKVVLIKEVVRYLAYAFLAFLVAEFLRFTASIDNSEAKFPELSLVEYAQSFFLIVSGLISLRFYLSKQRHFHRHIFMLISALCAMAFIREQDMHFETFVGDGTWPIPVFAILAVVIYKIFRIRKDLIAEIVSYMKTRSYGFFSAATITIFIFSRMFGRAVFWEAVMGDQYFRSVKNVAEESLELYGYLLLMIAVVELAIADKQLKKIKKIPLTDHSMEKPQRQFAAAH